MLNVTLRPSVRARAAKDVWGARGTGRAVYRVAGPARNSRHAPSQAGQMKSVCSGTLRPCAMAPCTSTGL